MRTLEQFNEFCAHKLNDEQRNAVIPQRGIFVVRAGAGSGKTRVITARIVNLMVAYDVSPSAILALTFTNKAAREMRERVVRMLPDGASVPCITTFHAYSLQIVKRYADRIGLAGFTILDTADRDALLSSLLKRHPRGKRMTPSQLGGAISRHKNSVVSLQQLYTRGWSDDFVEELFYAYEAARKAQRSVDFDDLLLEMLRLLQTNADCKAFLQRTIKHILIDEYQDTNRLQHAIITELIFDVQSMITVDSLCIVGDENQSIYSWRGATVENMGACMHHFPHVTPIAITQNYRSVQPILQVANHLIRHNTGYAPHMIWSERDAHDRVRLLTCYSSQQEAEIIAHCVAYFKRTRALHKVAVLYRSHFQSRAIEEMLVRNSIPYKIIGGIQFYDRQEIKDLLAYIRLAINPFDRISFARAINTPSRLLGDVFVEQCMGLWQSMDDVSYADMAAQLIKEIRLPARKLQSFTEFLDIIKEISTVDDMRIALDRLIARTDFIGYLTASYDPADAKERIANVHELIAAVVAARERGTIRLADFIEEIALLTEQSDASDDQREHVQLMTLHGAKGLEFDTVILPGLEEGLFPSAQSVARPESLEEERRLLYVGITRARERLILTRSLSRFMYGSVHEQIASRFIRELPSQWVRSVEYVRMYPREIQHDLELWLSGSMSESFLPAPLGADRSRVASAIASDDPMQWRVAERVHHAAFGSGTIIAIEERSNGALLTVRFARDTKKVQSQFVTKK